MNKRSRCHRALDTVYHKKNQNQKKPRIPFNKHEPEGNAREGEKSEKSPIGKDEDAFIRRPRRPRPLPLPPLPPRRSCRQGPRRGGGWTCWGP